MSLKVKEGLSYTDYGGSAFLFKKDGKYDWTSSISLIELIHTTGMWDFVDSEDEYLIKGAAFVAPLTLLYWSNEE